jgi:archaellum biogenesis protein FlaJ (TadC family)
MVRKIVLTLAVAVYVLVLLAAALAMASLGPILAALAVVGMAINGFVAADAVATIWNLEGQVDDGE